MNLKENHSRILFPLDTGRKLNVDKTFKRRAERLMYVQLLSCAYGITSANDDRFGWLQNVFLKCFEEG